jgi:hypothetical protein
LFIPHGLIVKGAVLALNLRNRMIFKAADEEGAVESADFLGKRKFVKRSWGFSSGRATSNYTEQDEHKMKPYALRSLPKHTCVLVHSERGFRRTLLPPLEPDGRASPWFKRRWI